MACRFKISTSHFVIFLLYHTNAERLNGVLVSHNKKNSKA